MCCARRGGRGGAQPGLNSPKPQPRCKEMGTAAADGSLHCRGHDQQYPATDTRLYLRISVRLRQPYDYTVITMTLLLGTANSTIIKKFISKSSWKLINFTAVSILSHCNKEKLSSRQIKSKLIALGESIQISLFHVRNLFLKQEGRVSMGTMWKSKSLNLSSQN